MFLVNHYSMMHTQSRKRKWVSPFSSFLSDSFLLFSLHFPLPLNCQSNCKRKKTTHSEDPNSGASSSSTLPRGGDFEGGGKQREGNNYEVFLSFRGQDTRKGFTDCLYTSLVDAGIHVFRDDDELQVGEEIGPELFRSITQSKISIPIISEYYASSKWCLRELALILKCKRERGQTLLPIFYKVEPWQVRHLAGTFGDAIDAHKKNVDEGTVQEWVKALEDVTYLKGWESEKTDNGHEGKFIKTVMRKVVRELKRQFLLNVPDELVGIDDRVEHIMSLINAKCNNSGMIGICGMGGIGKTTLAKVLYNTLSNRYECRSFVADIRETSKQGIACLQKKLISDLYGKLWDVSNVDEGINVLKNRFTMKKVLIILDDVNKETPLDALVGDGSWFAVGSIVILTTRDQSILDKARGSDKYPLNELDSHQSLILFSRHAFGKDSPPTGYEVISSDIVSTTGGLPLALEVIASFLCGKKKEAWKATSKKLKKVPNEDVQKRLRISYDALTSENKRMFLDIACFFIGSSKQYPTYMWDACGCYPGKGIEELSLLSLINIDENGYLLMHDQLRDMGREIVRLENEKKPEKRSRLWNYDDVVEVLGSNKGTSEIEALCLSKAGISYEEIGSSYVAEQFKGLCDLRFLSVRGANLIGDFQNLLPQLIWLQWNNWSSDLAAAKFHPKRLVVLDLSNSDISEYWGGWDQLKPPTIAAFGSGNASVGESLGDRGAPVAAMVGMNSQSLANVKPRNADESGDKSRIRKLTEINESSQCRSIRLPDNTTAVRVSRLTYTNSGSAILALSSNAIHKLWNWQESDKNLTGRATTSVVPQLWQPSSALLMTNDTNDTNPEDAVPCFALSKNDCYLMSTSGGKISLFNMITFKTMTTFMPQEDITIGMEDSSIQIYIGRVDEVQTKLKAHRRKIKGFAFSAVLNVLLSSGADSQMMTTFTPSPEAAAAAATFLAFYPQDNNIIAIGMDDFSILIYNARIDELKTSLRGHRKRITGLVFSNVLNVLVSSGADSQLCVWSIDGWEKQASRFLQMPAGRGAAPLADTCVQFHVRQIHLLVVHETQIAIYEAPKLECLQQWDTREASSPITDATYSCNGQSIYVSFEDGSIGVLNASTLGFRCRINPAAYIHPNPSLRAYPLVVAAHPSKPNQFALGLTDGSVYVLEPLESEGGCWA